MRTIALLLVVGCAHAPAPAPVPEARPADVSSIDGIMTAVYDVISGPAGTRDWDRFRSLFVPGARLIPIMPDGRTHIASVEDFVAGASEAVQKEGFYEKEIFRHVDTYGHLVQVFSTYESRHAADEAEPFQRGINSFQLLNDGKRWWVVTIYWQPERPDLPLPPEWLKH